MNRLSRQPTAGLACVADRVVRSPNCTAHYLEHGPEQTAHYLGRDPDLSGLVDETNLDGARGRARYFKTGPSHIAGLVEMYVPFTLGTR